MYLLIFFEKIPMNNCNIPHNRAECNRRIIDNQEFDYFGINISYRMMND